jgi:hypothetical protein
MPSALPGKVGQGLGVLRRFGRVWLFLRHTVDALHQQQHFVLHADNVGMRFWPLQHKPPKEQSLFVAAEEVQARADSIDRALAMDAQHLTPGRKIAMVGVSVLSLVQQGTGQGPVGVVRDVWSPVDRIERTRGGG